MLDTRQIQSLVKQSYKTTQALWHQMDMLYPKNRMACKQLRSKLQPLSTHLHK